MRVKLGEICSFTNGGTPKKSVPEYWTGEIPFITGADIDEERGTITEPRGYITEQAISNSATNLISTNSILLVTRTGVGKVAIPPYPVCISQDFTALSFDLNAVHQRFLFNVLRSAKKSFEQQARGATIQGITREVVSNYEFELPNYSEQERIAAILDKADEVSSQSNDALNMRTNLIRSVFSEMFGDPALNQNQFPIKPLSECILEIRTGKSLGKEDRELQPNEWGVLKTSAVTWGVFDPTQYKVAPDIDGSKYEQPTIGNLLFTRNNTWELVGATCVVDKETENLILPDRIWNIIPKPEIANTTFLHYLFKHPYVHALIANAASGTSGSMLNISQPKLKGVKTIIPPITLQNLFKQRVEQINSVFVTIADANNLSTTKSKAITQTMI